MESWVNSHLEVGQVVTRFLQMNLRQDESHGGEVIRLSVMFFVRTCFIFCSDLSQD